MSILNNPALRVLLLAMACALAVGCDSGRSDRQLAVSQMRHKPSTEQPSKSGIHDFLAAAAAADAMPDRLQRCLAFPDPPRSHWSRATVVAYCDYLFKPVVTAAEVRELVAAGHAAELDARLASALQAQLANPADPRLDAAYYQLFFDPPPDLRPVLDAWKKQSPDSAYAHAASAFAYLAAASTARGNAFIEETSDAQLEGMTKLLGPARADLERAVALEPRLAVAHSGMIMIGLYLRRDYALDAARRGFGVDPSNYLLFDGMRMAAEPRWGGSAKELADVVSRAQALAGRNPLLSLLRNEATAAELGLDECGCRVEKPLDLNSLFDQPARRDLLEGAALYADEIESNESAAVYYSEASRFGWDTPNNVSGRLDALQALDEFPFSLTAANYYLARKPGDTDALAGRATAYSHLRDRPHMKQDLAAILALRPDDLWALGSLGHEDVLNDNDLVHGAEIARRLLKSHPDKPDGWFLEAAIELKRKDPRAKASVATFMRRFGADPDEQEDVTFLRDLQSGVSYASRASDASSGDGGE